MAFTYTVDSEAHVGTIRVLSGTYTNTSSSTGGDIKTGLSVVKAFTLQPTTTAVLTSFPVVNETLPLTNTDGAVTIVTTTGSIGSWIAIG